MEEEEKDRSGKPFVLYDEDFINLGKAKGIETSFIRMLIRDVSVPTPLTMAAILNQIDGSNPADRPLYLHCWGGRGRTGTAVGCYLVGHGSTGEVALGKIRSFGEMSLWDICHPWKPRNKRKWFLIGTSSTSRGERIGNRSKGPLPGMFVRVSSRG